MRFFEYESREIVKRAGIPVTNYGFARPPRRRTRSPSEIGGPVVIKSQVLTGGRMKAGGVKFADTPEEASGHAEAILQLEINGHMPRGVLVDPKAAGQAGVLRRRRLGRHPQAAGDDLQRHGRHRHRGGRRASTPSTSGAGTSRTSSRCRTSARRRSSPQTGVTGRQLTRITPILARLATALRRLRHDARRDQPARRARGRQLRRPRRAHGDGERGPAAPAGAV